MRKLLLCGLAMFMFVGNLNAEESIAFISKRLQPNVTFNIITEEMVHLEDTSSILGTSIEYSLDYINDGTLVVSDGVCSEVTTNTEENTVTCINDTMNYNGLTFTEEGTYDIKLKYSAETGVESEETYVATITYTVTEKKYDYVTDEKTIEIYKNESISLQKANTSSALLIFHEYIDYNLISIDEEAMCNVGVTDYADVLECVNDKTSFDNIVFNEVGVYELVDSYAVDSETVHTTYDVFYKIIVTDKVEVNKSETEVEVDNKVVITGLDKGESVTSEIVVPTDNALNSITVSALEFNKAKEYDVSLVYEIKDEDDSLSYSWTFNSDALGENTTEDMNLKIDVSEISKELESEFNEKDALLITFQFHGGLPGEAKVKIYVGDKYKAGNVLSFYYNNKDTDKIELIEEGLVVDKNGYVTVAIDHCSEYVFNKTAESLPANGELDDEPKMGDNINYILFASIGLSALTYTIIKKRKFN